MTNVTNKAIMKSVPTPPTAPPMVLPASLCAASSSCCAVQAAASIIRQRIPVVAAFRGMHAWVMGTVRASPRQPSSSHVHRRSLAIISSNGQWRFYCTQPNSTSFMNKVSWEICFPSHRHPSKGQWCLPTTKPSWCVLAPTRFFSSSLYAACLRHSMAGWHSADRKSKASGISSSSTTARCPRITTARFALEAVLFVA